MSGHALACALAIVRSGQPAGFTKAHISQNVATNNVNAPKQIRKNGRTLRFRKRVSFSRIARSRLRNATVHFGGDPEGSDEDQDVRKIYENIRFQRNATKVLEKIKEHIN